MKFPVFLSLLLVAPHAFVSPALAMECDNFTDRDRAVFDSLEPLDAFTNRQLARALRDTNRWKKSCDRETLFRELDSKLGGLGFGRIENWAERSADVEKIQESINDGNHIYRGSSFWKLPLMSIGGVAHSIRVAGHVVGTDKLGHFMSEGLHYFNVMQKKEGSLAKALIWGRETEEGIYGLGVSGVKAYADLAANYDGMRFWSNVLDGDNPYFSCVGGDFFQVRPFSWEDYVTDAWDEGINCSVFKEHMAKVFLANLAELEMTCPVKGTEIACHELQKLPNAVAYVNPICMDMPSTGEYHFDPKALLFREGRRGD